MFQAIKKKIIKSIVFTEMDMLESGGAVDYVFSDALLSQFIQKKNERVSFANVRLQRKRLRYNRRFQIPKSLQKYAGGDADR